MDKLRRNKPLLKVRGIAIICKMNAGFLIRLLLFLMSFEEQGSGSLFANSLYSKGIQHSAFSIQNSTPACRPQEDRFNISLPEQGTIRIFAACIYSCGSLRSVMVSAKNINIHYVVR